MRVPFDPAQHRRDRLGVIGLGSTVHNQMGRLVMEGRQRY